MRLRLIAAAAVLALVAAGCGGGGSSRRDEVARYIEDVNAIQARAEQPARAVSQAARELATTRGDRVAAERKLRRAAARFDALRKEVAGVAAPADARKLRTLLLERMEGQAELAREAAAFVAFVPAFGAALAPLAPAGSTLREALAGKGSAAVKAEALDAYAAEIGTALEALGAVTPPPVSAPLYATQVKTLERVRAAVRALARALREQRAQDVPKLLRRFQLAVAGNQSLPAQRAQIAAVRAYNERVRKLDQLGRRIALERVRLARLLA